MTEHVSTSRMERICARALLGTELTTVSGHLAQCPECHQQFVATLRRQRGTTPVTFTLAPELWLRHKHIDYEQLLALAENKLDATDRELIDVHLKVCTHCREDVRSFLAFREQIVPQLGVSFLPVALEPAREKLPWWNSWRGLAWKPIYGVAIVVLGIALIIGGLFLKRRADNFQAQQTPSPNVNLGVASQTPTPDSRAADVPSPPATPNESPTEKPNSEEALVVLNDRGGTITLDKSGNVGGLDDVPAPTRDEIARVLLSERIESPAILKELGGQEGTLRGSNDAQPFKLISPSRSVIVTDRPTLKWEKASDASSYRVYVNDQAGNEVARSEELPSEGTEWVLPKPLKRGEIYIWTVVAVVDGKEIVSPGPSSGEMKFQVLSASSLQQLSKLKKTRLHLALGVSYAKFGMIDAAEREFQELVRLNPVAKIAKKLLRSVRLIRGTPR